MGPFGYPIQDGDFVWSPSTTPGLAPPYDACRPIEPLPSAVMMKHFLLGLRTFLVGPDRPVRRGPVAWFLGSAGAIYLTYAASTYLDAKSALPAWLCWPAGVALAAPFVLAVTRPLLAWRVAWLAAMATGTAVQLHQRTPFSWHPAVLVELVVLACLVAVRHRLTVTAWAWTSLAALIAVSFFPADRLPLIEIVTVPFAITALIGHRRRLPTGTSPAPVGTPSL